MKRPDLVRYAESETAIPDHLGGSCKRSHFDAVTLKYLRDTYDIKSMLDVGCGAGAMVMTARELGVAAVGVDGDMNCMPDILIDFTKPYEPPISGWPKYDLIWSMEFLEHVGAEFIPNYMPLFQLGSYAFVTYAPPGKKGHHHVNCQPQAYWLNVFDKYGFEFMAAETRNIRETSVLSTALIPSGEIISPSHKRFIRDYGLLFKRL